MAQTLHTETRTGRWTIWRFLGAVALTAAGVFVARDAWHDIFRIATTDEDSSHIFLVAVAVPWLVWARWGRVRGCAPRGGWVGPLLAVVGGAALIFGYDHRYDVLWHGGAVLVAVGCALSFLGRDVLVRLLPAFVVLAFLLPVPGRARGWINMPLQQSTAYLTEQICQVLGMGVGRAGNVLIAGGHRIEVAEACSGMRMVFGLFLVAYTFAFATPLRAGVRAFVLLTAPLLALLCNLMRVIPTVGVYATADRAVADRFHDAAGWVMIFVSYLLLMGGVRLLQWAGVDLVRRPAARTADRSSAPPHAAEMPRSCAKPLAR